MLRERHPDRATNHRPTLRTSSIFARLKPCPDGHPEHRLVEADAETLAGLGLPQGALLHMSMGRQPRNDDLVLAELVTGGRLTRTIRHYTSVGGSGGIVTLARPGQTPASLVRPRYEVSILGVVDGHILPLIAPPAASSGVA